MRSSLGKYVGVSYRPSGDWKHTQENVQTATPATPDDSAQISKFSPTFSTRLEKRRFFGANRPPTRLNKGAGARISR